MDYEKRNNQVIVALFLVLLVCLGLIGVAIHYRRENIALRESTTESSQLKNALFLQSYLAEIESYGTYLDGRFYLTVLNTEANLSRFKAEDLELLLPNGTEAANTVEFEVAAREWASFRAIFDESGEKCIGIQFEAIDGEDRIKEFHFADIPLEVKHD